MRGALKAAAEEVGLALSAEEVERLVTLVGLWQRYGRVNRLTADLRDGALVTQIQEGMAAVACAREGAPQGGAWLDVGSGGGFPGLVAVALWGHEVVMVEPRERRCAFLELAAARIGGRSRIVRGRWEGSTWNLDAVDALEMRDKTSWSVISARAVWARDRWREYAPRMAPGALVIRHGRGDLGIWSGWARVCERKVGEWRVAGERLGGG